MGLLQSVAMLLAVLMAPVSPVTHVMEAEGVEAAQEIIQPQQSEDWRLLLVNRWNKLPEGYSVEMKTIFGGLQVDSRIYDDLSAMLSDCRAEGLRPIICSAYRSESTQTRLHNNKVARLRAAGYSQDAARQEAVRWVAIPGTSEHHTGMALDIVSQSYQTLDHKQENTAEQKWLMEHCWEYGFILRYPADKSVITGIGYEPWHYRYVGREAAMAMRESGLCLEEYLRTLKAAETPVETDVETQMKTETKNQQETASAVS